MNLSSISHRPDAVLTEMCCFVRDMKLRLSWENRVIQAVDLIVYKFNLSLMADQSSFRIFLVWMIFFRFFLFCFTVSQHCAFHTPPVCGCFHMSTCVVCQHATQ